LEHPVDEGRSLQAVEDTSGSRDGCAPQVTLILPAYNEGRRIATGLGTLLTSLQRGELGEQAFEIIVVDDGSDDDTATQAEHLLTATPRSMVVRLPENRGKGAAIREGVARANGDVVVFMDVDMAVHPSQLPSLLSALDAHDVAVGSRSLPGSVTRDDTLLRTVTGRTFSRLTEGLIGLPLRDTQCGFKALRTPVARVVCHYAKVDRFAFDVDLLSTSVRLGLRVIELPVEWIQVSGSRIRPLADPLSMLVDLFRIRRRREDERLDAIVIRSAPGLPTTFASLRALLSATAAGSPWDDRGLVLLPLSGADEVARVIRILRADEDVSDTAPPSGHAGNAAPLTFKERTMLRDVAMACADTTDVRRIAN